jgi:prephenate dehydrogenase
MGASAGLALSGQGVLVTIEDSSPAAQAMAAEAGAGRLRQGDDQDPELVIVGTPPDVTAQVVAQQLERFPGATVTDLASVKAIILDELSGLGADLGRYVGSHPMAGRERTGAASASADLFIGRAWAIAPSPLAGPAAVRQIRDLAADLGAHSVYLTAQAHDRAVALVSHVPQILSTLTAKQLIGAEEAALELAGQGLRDQTRIAGSDPNLWAVILAGNGPAVAAVLRQVREDLDQAITALSLGAGEETLGKSLVGLAGLLTDGNRGAARIPGKHGGAKRQFDKVTVIVPDRPGQLGRLFRQMGRIRVNLEDLNLEHAAGKEFGLAEVSVPQGDGDRLTRHLKAKKWKIVS